MKLLREWEIHANGFSLPIIISLQPHHHFLFDQPCLERQELFKSQNLYVALNWIDNFWLTSVSEGTYAKPIQVHLEQTSVQIAGAVQEWHMAPYYLHKHAATATINL